MTRKDFLIDCLLCILFKASGPLVRCFPKAFGLALGRWLGGVYYYFDIRHRGLVYANLKTVFGGELSCAELSRLSRQFYRAFGENIMEVFLIPLVDKNYLKKYIEIKGRENVQAAFEKGKGVILLAMHEGSWELSNIICAHLVFPFNFFVRDQKFPRLDRMLNIYRTQQGCRIIQRENQLRQLVEVLRKNEAIGITADQGGKTGAVVNFFGRSASMSTGGVKLALKSGATIIPCFYVRLNGPYIRVIFGAPFEVKKTGLRDKDVQDNLQGLVKVFEKFITAYPKEYLWSYKIWKYGLDKNVLILNDSKAGHLRQSQAVAAHLSDCLKERSNAAAVDVVEVKFKNRFSKSALTLGACLSGRRRCQGCLACLRAFLTGETYRSLTNKKYDFVISCGASLAAVNFLIARENLAKSIALLRPSIFSARKFDLVVMPRHDRPPRRKNLVITEGALNLVNEGYLRRQVEGINRLSTIHYPLSTLCIGLLIGGDTKDFCLDGNLVLEAIRQLKQTAQNLDADILVTTSRRTSAEIENLMESEFRNYPRCKLLVIANRKNIPEAMGGILGLSSAVVVSPESISMISEAASSKKYVFVFNARGLGRRHRSFLHYFKKNRYISLVEAENLSAAIRDLWQNKPQPRYPDDSFKVREALKLLI